MLFIEPSPGVNRHAGQKDEFVGVTAVQRHFHDLLVIHHCANARTAGLNLQCIGFYCYLLAHRTQLHGYVNGGLCVDLEHDPGSYVIGEPFLRDFQ